jgi:hypothetical protein
VPTGLKIANGRTLGEDDSGPSPHPHQAVLKFVTRKSLTKCRVSGDHRLFEAQRSRQVGNRTWKRGDGYPVDDDHLARIKGCSMQLGGRSCLAAWNLIARQLHPCQGGGEQRHSVEHRC